MNKVYHKGLKLSAFSAIQAKKKEEEIPREIGNPNSIKIMNRRILQKGKPIEVRVCFREKHIPHQASSKKFFFLFELSPYFRFLKKVIDDNRDTVDEDRVSS